MSILKPEASIGIGLATAGIVGFLFQKAEPNLADLRIVDSDNPDINSANKQALWTSAAVVGGISLIARDPTIFTIGGAMAVAMYWFHAHANLVSPLTGRAVGDIKVPDMPAETQEQIPDAYGYSGDIIG